MTSIYESSVNKWAFHDDYIMTIIKNLVTIDNEKFGLNGEYIVYGTTIDDIGTIPSGSKVKVDLSGWLDNIVIQFNGVRYKLDLKVHVSI